MDIASTLNFTEKQKTLQLYEDMNATRNVIGGLLKDPQLVLAHHLTEADFVLPLQKMLFAVIHNLARNGAQSIGVADIEGYLDPSKYPMHYEVYKAHDGTKYVNQALKLSDVSNFAYYYEEVKKYSLLRDYVAAGIDVSEFYNPKETDPNKMASGQDKLRSFNLPQLCNYFQTKIAKINSQYDSNRTEGCFKAGGDKTKEQIEKFEEGNNYGISYASNFLTAATCGIRQGRFSLMSGGTGSGKSRIMLANIGHSFAPEFWNPKTKCWQKNPNGTNNRALYIGTEMDSRTEVEPILLGYIANVSSEKIEHPDVYPYVDDERERVMHAADVLNDGHIFLKNMPDYTLAKLEQLIADYSLNYGVTHIFLDYIHTNADLIREFKQMTGLNEEYQVLNNLSVKLKEWTAKYNVSIDSSTQLNGDYGNEQIRDQRLLRGAKSIADKIDFGCILSTPTDHERKLIDTYYKTCTHLPHTQLRCLSVYKNRAGRHVNIKIWLDIDYGTMRIHDLFVTDDHFNLYQDIDKVTLMLDEDTNMLVPYKNYAAMEIALREKDAINTTSILNTEGIESLLTEEEQIALDSIPMEEIEIGEEYSSGIEEDDPGCDR